MNFNKSSLYFSLNTSNQNKNETVTILQIQHKTTIGKYLGIHNIVLWKDAMNGSELCRRVKQKLAGWKANTLSKIGRLTLIQANLTCMPNHRMSYFKCPHKIISQLNKDCGHFFWGNTKNWNPVNWKNVCRPKQAGDLGIKNIEHFNRVCLAKLGWKVLFDKENWWANIVRRKNLRTDSFMETKAKQNHSTSWKGILGVKDIISKGMRWVVGDGKDILFWTQKYVFPHPLFHLTPENQLQHVE